MNDNNYDDSDESTDHTPAFFGEVGTGKTHQIGTELARRLTDETEPTEWFDPKGEENRNRGEN